MLRTAGRRAVRASEPPCRRALRACVLEPDSLRQAGSRAQLPQPPRPLRLRPRAWQPAAGWLEDAAPPATAPTRPSAAGCQARRRGCLVKYWRACT